MSQSRIPVECSREGHLMVDVKLQLSDGIIKYLNRALGWWEIAHVRSAPQIYVSSLYPKDFGNIEAFGPDAGQKLRGMWDSGEKAVILLANIQILHPRILVSLLFHELGHCLMGHNTTRNKLPTMREEKEAERIAVKDYIKYFGKNAIVPQDPRLGGSFYRSLGLRKAQPHTLEKKASSNLVR